MEQSASKDASRVSAENGEVFVEGPDGIIASMTSEAAEETSSRLRAGAAEAARQRRDLGREKRPAAEADQGGAE